MRIIRWRAGGQHPGETYQLIRSQQVMLTRGGKTGRAKMHKEGKLQNKAGLPVL